MKDKINTIEDLKKEVSDAFHVLEPSPHRKGLAFVSIPVNSYAELSYYIFDVITVSVAALEAEHENLTELKKVPSAVAGVLEKLLNIIPLEEMNLLDKIRESFLEDDLPDK